MNVEKLVEQTNKEISAMKLYTAEAVHEVKDGVEQESVYYRIADPNGVRVATCGDQGNAQTVAFALNALRLKKHPDTERLDHLIAWDHCKVGAGGVCDPEMLGPVEKIEFIFENVTGGDKREAVRAAIDRSRGASLVLEAERALQSTSDTENAARYLFIRSLAVMAEAQLELCANAMEAMFPSDFDGRPTPEQIDAAVDAARLAIAGQEKELAKP